MTSPAGAAFLHHLTHLRAPRSTTTEQRLELLAHLQIMYQVTAKNCETIYRPAEATSLHHLITHPGPSFDNYRAPFGVLLAHLQLSELLQCEHTMTVQVGLAKDTRR